MSNGSFSQSQIDNMKRIGKGGGSVNTNGMTYTDKQAADKADNDGKSGK